MNSQPTLLRIDASARQEGSTSRSLGDSFVREWKSRSAQGRVLVRDLVAEPIPLITAETIGAFFTPPDQLTAAQKASARLSDRLIAEIKSADELLITVPMYNFGIPSSLKAWIDQIARVGHTFSFDGSSFAGLLKGKKMHVAVAYGASGYVNGGGFAAANFVEPYLKFMFGFLGFDDVIFYSVESTSTDTEAAAQDATRAKGQMAAAIGAAAANAGRAQAAA